MSSGYYIYLLSKSLKDGTVKRYCGMSMQLERIRKYDHMKQIRNGTKSSKWNGLDDKDWKFEKIYEFKNDETSEEMHKQEEKFRILHDCNLNERRCILDYRTPGNIARLRSFKCKCGGKYTGWNKTKHEKTNKHQSWKNSPKLQ